MYQSIYRLYDRSSEGNFLADNTIDTELGAYKPFNAFSPTSSGFQPNINMPNGGYPSSTPLIPSIRIENVEECTKTVFQAMNNLYFNSNHHAHYSLNAESQPYSPVGVYQQSAQAIEANQQPNNTVRDYQQMKKNTDNLHQAKEQAAHDLDEAAHNLNVLRNSVLFLAPRQQAAQTPVDPIANDISFEALRLQFCDATENCLDNLFALDFVVFVGSSSIRPVPTTTQLLLCPIFSRAFKACKNQKCNLRNHLKNVHN
ncbi:hypothetical protein BGX24_006699, partial [Mortierella sp. AD032]